MGLIRHEERFELTETTKRNSSRTWRLCVCMCVHVRLCCVCVFVLYAGKCASLEALRSD